MLQVEVTRVREAAAAMEAASVTVVLVVETSTQEAAAAWDSVALHVDDVEDRATLAGREALERVSRVEVKNVTALAYAREDADGFD
jgi:hypothetical protein